MSWTERESARLNEGLALLGFPLPPGLSGGLEAFAREVLLWNPTHGLLGHRDFPSSEEAVIHHILDCLAPGELFLREQARRGSAGGEAMSIGDVGSGAGFPGIPLALVLPDCRLTLIEKMGRRCDFLRNAAAVLGLKDRVEILQKPAEDLSRTFDICTLRAFAPLSRAGETLLKLTKPGGKIFAYKGKEEVFREEMTGFSRWESFPLEVPFFSGERHMVVIRRAPL